MKTIATAYLATGIAFLIVDAIWLSPFFKSPMADMGYDVSDSAMSIRCSARLPISTPCWRRRTASA